MELTFKFKSIKDLVARIKAWEILYDKPRAFLLGNLEITLDGNWEFDNGIFHGRTNWESLYGGRVINVGRKYLVVMADRKVIKNVRPYRSTNDPQMFSPIIKFSYWD